MTLDKLSKCLWISAAGANLHLDITCPYHECDKKAYYLSMCRYSEHVIKSKKQKVENSSSRNIMFGGHLHVSDRLLH